MDIYNQLTKQQVQKIRILHALITVLLLTRDAIGFPLLSHNVISSISTTSSRIQKGLLTWTSTDRIIIPTTRIPSSVQSSSVLFASSREEEILKLEEQLRQLKREEEENAKDDTVVQEVNAAAEVERKLEKIKGKDMLLSEQELITGGIVDLNDNISQMPSGASIIPAAIGAVVALVLLISFAQVPVGQDGLAQYSATGSSTTAFKQIDLGDINPSKPQSSSLSN
jgi:hypothetical protein